MEIDKSSNIAPDFLNWYFIKPIEILQSLIAIIYFQTRRELARQVLCVAVNNENPWTIEKWHIRAAFRRAGFWVPDHAIVMGEKAISGPDPELEGKQFLVTITVILFLAGINLIGTKT